MQQDARRIKDGTSAAQTAAATADLGVACGLCHQKLGGPKVSSEPLPVQATSLEGIMKRHTWASERLWEGLVVPSSDAWNTGANALSGTAFPPEVLNRGGVHARSAASDFAGLVAKAAARKTMEERAALYAELLVTCGSCHRAMREASTK
jgi:cytochrome c556